MPNTLRRWGIAFSLLAFTFSLQPVAALAEEAGNQIQERLDQLQERVDRLETLQEKTRERMENPPDGITARVQGIVGLRYHLVTPRLFSDTGSMFRNALVHGPQAFFRLGLTGRLVGRFNYGVRVTLGDPMSPAGSWVNVGNFLTKQPFNLDQFFINWRAVNAHPVGRGQLFMDVTGGKFPDPFANTELLWDVDVIPTGLAQVIEFRELTPIVDRLTFSMGELVVNLARGTPNTFLFGGKFAGTFFASDEWRLNGALGFHSYTNPSGIAQAKLSNGIFGTTANNFPGPGGPGVDFRSNFQLFNPFFQATYEFSPSYPLSLFVDYLYNVGAPSDNSAYHAGIKLGRTRQVGEFEVGYTYKYIQADANISSFVQDLLGGTDTFGHEVQVGVRVAPKTLFFTHFQVANRILVPNLNNLFTVRMTFAQLF